MANLDELSDSQQAAFAQLHAITDGADVDVEIEVLQSVDWDVQRAVEVLFDMNTSDQREHSRPHVPREEMTVDDSEQNVWQPPSTSWTTYGLRLLTYPFAISINFVSSLLNFVLRILRLPTMTFSSIWRPTPRRNLPDDPASVIDRWVRQLEDETGAVRGGHNFVAVGTATGAEAGPGPSTLSRRTETLRDDIRRLPEFFFGSYEQALKAAQKEARVLCVILLCDEHDDVPEFKRSTLTDPELNNVLKTHEFLAWGGDVREREAHQAAQKLSATTYPFVAFVALQPRAGSRNASNASQPTLTVLSRHQGPAIPNGPTVASSALGPTSSRALCDHLNNSLLPRVTPYLGRLKSTQRERDFERQLREEQDAAFALTAQRDRERIQAKMAAEKEARLAAERAERERKEAEEVRQKEIEERQNKEALRMEWYRYARKGLLSPEPAPGAGSVRIGIRMPDGRRLIRLFKPSDSLTALYTFVAIQEIAPDMPADGDPSNPPTGYLAGETGIKVEGWPFKLVSTFPRAEIPWQAEKTLQEVDALRGGAQLVVETIGPMNGDDYDTEEE